MSNPTNATNAPRAAAAVDRKELATLLRPFSGQRGAAVPALEAVQAKYGYIPHQALDVVAQIIGVLPAEVFGVASFYEEFRFAPPGAHVIGVCTGTSCHVAGGHQLLDLITKELGIKPGQTTPDGQFTLEHVACPGPCAIGPVLMVDGQPQARATAQSIRGLLAALRARKS